jgi:hypothetical protein
VKCIFGWLGSQGVNFVGLFAGKMCGKLKKLEINKCNEDLTSIIQSKLVLSVSSFPS